MLSLPGVIQNSSGMTSEEKMHNIHKSTQILMFCGTIAFISVLILNAILLIKLLPLNDKYETPLGDFPSPTVLNKVPGQTGPAARLGDILVLQQDRCLNRPTKISTQTIWSSSDRNVSVPNIDPIRSNTMQGCATSTLPLQMPDKITPGMWFIQGIVRDEPSGDVRYWTSEIFVVVP